jgi:hypothetical protein
MERIHDYSRYLQQCESISEQIEQHLGKNTYHKKNKKRTKNFTYHPIIFTPPPPYIMYYLNTFLRWMSSMQ